MSTARALSDDVVALLDDVDLDAAAREFFGMAEFPDGSPVVFSKLTAPEQRGARAAWLTKRAKEAPAPTTKPPAVVPGASVVTRDSLELILGAIGDFTREHVGTELNFANVELNGRLQAMVDATVKSQIGVYVETVIDSAIERELGGFRRRLIELRAVFAGRGTELDLSELTTAEEIIDRTLREHK